MTDTTAAIVTEVCAPIGSKIPAYIVGHTSTKQVNSWARGDTEPGEEALEKLVALRDGIRLLLEREGHATISSWLFGTNPFLADRAPAEVLRDGGLTAFAQAAQHFYAGG